MNCVGMGNEQKVYTVIAEVFVRELISYFRLKVRNFVAYKNDAHNYNSVCDTVLAVRKFIVYESSRTLEYKILTLLKFSSITVRDYSKAVVPLAQTRKIILRDTPVSMGIR